jgi:predicted dehydrogenase
VVEFQGRPELLQFSLVEQGQAIPHRDRFVRVMSHVEKRGFQRPLQLGQFQTELFSEGRIETAEWFVEEVDVSRPGDRPSDGDTLSLATRQFPDAAGKEPANRQQVRDLGDPIVLVLAGPAESPEAESQVVGHGQMGIEGLALKDHRHAAVPGGGAGNLLPSNLKLPRCGPLQTGNQSQSRRLSTPRRPGQNQELSPLNLERQIAEDFPGPESLDQLLHSNRRRKCVRFFFGQICISEGVEGKTGQIMFSHANRIQATGEGAEKMSLMKRNRRQFLEDSMVATAAAMAAGSAPTLLAEENQSSSPNEKLGVAVVGVRGRGGSHIGAFAGRKDTEVLYLCDADREIGGRRVEEVAKRQGRAPQFVEDLRTLLEDERVDIVSIASPNHLHALQAIWSIQAGKDVYLEKPVSHNVSEGRRIVQAARKYGKICQTGTQCRSNRGMIDAMAYVHEGKIGQLKVARGLCYKRRGSIGPRGQYEVPSSVNYDLWLGPAPESPVTRRQFHYDWHWQWDYGNGDLGNQGIHQMDLARWGMGIEGLSDRVFSYGGRFGYEDAGETANTQVVVHEYGDQSLVFEVRGLETDHYKGAGVGVIFEGTDGYLVITSYTDGAAFDLDGNVVAKFSGGGDHFSNFLQGVRSRKHADLTADIEEGHISSALCHLGNISYLLGSSQTPAETRRHLDSLRSADDLQATFDRTMKHLADNKLEVESLPLQVGPALDFNPKTEQFVEHAEADRMLTRDYRAPFIVPSEADV